MTKIEFIQDYIHQLYPDCIRYDCVTDKLQLKSVPSPSNIGGAQGTWRELTKRDINTMVCECATLSEKNITDKEVRCVLNSDFIPRVHPLREYILSLPEYNPQSGDWIDDLAAQVLLVDNGNPTNQSRWQMVFKKWFVAMVAAWMEDDVVNQHVLVLIGKQGIYKTTWLERLLPPELRSYGCKLSNLHDMDKDDRLRLAESALINIDEIDALTERELNQMKSVITSADVNERAAYGYSKERRLRLASFCASGNKREFLTDTTGNRRWLPFEVETIQSPFLNPAQPYQMYYAQAYYLYKHGFNYWFDTDDIRAMENYTETFHRETSEEQLLEVFYSPANLDTQGAVLRTAAEISAKLTWQGNIRKPMSLQQMGRLLSARGFVQKRIHGGTRGYLVIEHQRNMVEDEARMSKLKELEKCDNGDNGDNTF